jgi:hypothetical protein
MGRAARKLQMVIALSTFAEDEAALMSVVAGGINHDQNARRENINQQQ